MDLPPPPIYPKAREVIPTPEPRPIIPFPSLDTQQRDTFEKNSSFVPTEKIEMPIGKLMSIKTELAQPQKPEQTEELSRERILKAIGIESKEPLYVMVDNYREIMEGTNQVRSHLKEANDVIVRLGELKNEEDKEFEKWRLELEDMQRKLMYVDKVIFESK